ncbi:EAL domain-containing protein [Bacillus testis]|uniref:EAL domain-containing protein n=1 Tax=Bacillus testis TaxID=1622072 RepID=UPI00067EB40D|nr:EAL domain-containing protein [Bacillus testis]
MDPMEVLTNFSQLEAFLQPIFSADEHIVIGYEILGRYKTDKGYESLGPFFSDHSVPEEYRIDVDNIILEQALAKLADQEDECFIFINRDPHLLMYDHGEGFLEIIKRYFPEQKMHRIVLELSEKSFSGNMESLLHLLTYYKTYGIKIAIDHLGVDSHLDRISAISPQILKISLDHLKMQRWDTFADTISLWGELSRKMGATLLFENIETVYQLQFAWRHGGRYYQGFYLAQPSPAAIGRESLKERFKRECHSFIDSEKMSLEKKYDEKKKLQLELERCVRKSRAASGERQPLLELAKMLESYAFRLYVCDEDGFQKSPNFLKTNQGWSIQEHYIDKNWSWRPYFLKTIIKMRNDQEGFLSDSYSDIETAQTIRTFSLPLRDNEYLFIDISYEYLYEHNIF